MTSMAEDDDAFFASIDVDAIIAYDKQTKQTSPPTVAKARAKDEGEKGSQAQTKLPFKADVEEAALKRTLSDIFGYDEFRYDQLPVIQAALQGNDVSVLWATGCGKSLCYQLPAFHSNSTVLVVSPLISLMNDQVIAINNKAPGKGNLPPATFLGSGNIDAGSEAAALRGDYNLVYVTPEKLSSSSFLEQLRPLADSGKLKLVAIDEAHCVSQWGPDFRPSYYELNKIREVLPSIPIMALTATAVPVVREDIARVLKLRSPLWSITSFDRPNLAISVKRKRGMLTDLEDLLKQIREGTSGSTIVYVPTTAETETVANTLRQKLDGKVDVRFYHGKLGLAERSQTHRDFLSGVVQVVVATVAFGMGIDKPDIRQVVHYGAPKTFEEYYQQVGRAGRDGLPSTCQMIYADNDFANYGSDFYVGSLTPEARKAVESSTAAIRRYANDRTVCRRRAILAHFEETPAWDTCGTCDVCMSARDGSKPLQRDFRAEAAVLLQAVAACGLRPPATTNLLNLIGDGAMPQNMNVSADARARLQAARKALPATNQRQEVLKDFVVELHAKNLLQKKRVKSGTYSWEVNEITPAGQQQLSQNKPLLLALPPVLQAAEEAKEKKVKEQLAELAKAGIKAEDIPKQEIDAGHGQVLSTHLMWSRTIQRHRDNGREEAVELMELLLRRIFEWRDRKAVELSMAPANVLQEHTAKRIAYSRVTSVEALRAAGVRIRGVEELAEVVSAVLEEAGALQGSSQGGGEESGGQQGRGSNAAMLLPEGQVEPQKPWALAVYKGGRGKVAKQPVWEVSWDRFQKKEHVQSIAMKQASGKPILPNTVLGHLQEALVQGRSVDLKRLASEAGSLLPSAADWETFEEAAFANGVDPVKEERYSTKELLMAATGREDKEFALKSETEKEEDRGWRQKIGWWASLKRAGITPKFEGDASAAKRQRIS